MPIGEPIVHVECDKCGFVSDPYDMTLLAGGGYDDRNLKPKIIREGWTVEGETTICPECNHKE